MEELKKDAHIQFRIPKRYVELLRRRLIKEETANTAARRLLMEILDDLSNRPPDQTKKAP